MEEVSALLAARSSPPAVVPARVMPVYKGLSSTPQPRACSATSGSPGFVLSYHKRSALVVEFARNHAVDTVPGTPSKEQLQDFADEVKAFSQGLGLGENQALLEASRAKTELCRIKGIQLAPEAPTMEMPGLEFDDAIEYLVDVQNAVGELFDDVLESQSKDEPLSVAPMKRKRAESVDAKPKIKAERRSSVVVEENSANSLPEKSKQARKRLRRDAAAVATAVSAKAVPTSSTGPVKLNRRENQEKFRQDSMKNKPIIKKPIVRAAIKPVADSEAESVVSTQSPKLEANGIATSSVSSPPQVVLNIAPQALSPIVSEATVTAASHYKKKREIEKSNATKSQLRDVMDVDVATGTAGVKQLASAKPVIAPSTVISRPAVVSNPGPQAPESTTSEAINVTTSTPKKRRRREKNSIVRTSMGDAMDVDTPPVTVEVGQPVSPGPVDVASTVRSLSEAVLTTVPQASKPTSSETTNKAASNSKRRRRRERPSVAKGALEDAMDIDTAPAAVVDQPVSPEQVAAASNTLGKAEDSRRLTAGAVDTPVSDKPLDKTKRGRRNRTKGGALDINNGTTGVTSPILPPTSKPVPTTAAENPTPAQKVVVAADDGFIDLRAPKKKQRPRKSMDAAEKASNSKAAEDAKSVAVIVDSKAQSPPELVKAQATVDNNKTTTEAIQEADVEVHASEKNKRNRRDKREKKSLGGEQQTIATVVAILPGSKPTKPNSEAPSQKTAVVTLDSTSQPLSEMQPSNSQSNRPRKRGARKSLGGTKTETKVTIGEPAIPTSAETEQSKEHHS